MTPCSWCGEPTDNILASGILFKGKHVTLAAHADNELNGLSCLEWIYVEIDATSPN